jgi:uncharacterized damage-inducible protein DinB
MTIEPKILTQTLPSSFTSIDYTVQHILRLQKFWHLFIIQKDTTILNWAVRENESTIILKELIDQSVEMETDFKKFAELDLVEIIHLDMPWAKNSLSRYEYILHTVNHSTYHRGQIITMARNVGISDNIPNTDYNIFNCEKNMISY